MADYTAYLGNFTVCGCEVTCFPDGSRLRDRIKLAVAGRELICTQLPEVIKDYIRNQPRGVFVDSTRVQIANVTDADIPALREMVDRVAELFSFSTESRVVRYGDDFPVGSMRERRSVAGTVQTWRAPFNTTDDLKRFVETAYPTFVALRTPRQLAVVIDYIHFATMRGLPLEGQLTLSFVLLENLRHTYISSKGVAKAAFATDLIAMFAEVGMAPDVTRIKNARNELIHEGVLSTPSDENWRTFELCQTAIREYLLRLLGYKGAYFGYDLTFQTIS